MNPRRLLPLALLAIIALQIPLVNAAVLPSSITNIASDAENGQSSVATQGGQKLIEDSFGKFIEVYQDTSGRIGVTYTNSDPALSTSWATPVKAGAASQYRTPAAVLVSLTSLRIIVEEGPGPGNIKDLAVTVTRDSSSNIVGVSFASGTTLDSSGKAEFPAAILANNGDIIAAWSWLDATSSARVKALRWSASVGWRSLTGSGGVPDDVIVDTSNRVEILPNLIQRPDNSHIYLFGNRDEDSQAKNLVYNKATFDGTNWSWGTQNLSYENNAARGMFDLPSLVWDPFRSLVVVAYDISGTTKYGVFTLNSQDQKTHIDTPSLQMGNNEWGSIAVHPTTGDYYLFTIDTIDLAVFHDNGMLGYTWRSGGSWNTALTIVDSDTNNIGTNLRRVGNSPFIDLISEKSRTLRLVRFSLLADTSPPSQPTDLTASIVSPTRVDLSWQPSTDNNVVAGYDLYRNGTTLGSSTGTSYSDLSVFPSNTYVYTVVARDTTGNLSPPSNPATAIMPRGGVLYPTDDSYIRADRADRNFGRFNVLRTDNSPVTDFLVKFSITGIGDNPVLTAKLRLYNQDASNRGGDFYNALGNNWSEATVTWNNAPAAGSTLLASLGAVTSGSWYEVDVKPLISGDGAITLRVRSTSGDSAGYSSKEGANKPLLVYTIQDCNDCEPPSQPQNLNATALTSTEVGLTWDPSTDNIGVSGYDLLRGGTKIATVSGVTNAYSDNTVGPATTYTYNVIAFDAEGNPSLPSNPATVTTPGTGGVHTFAPTDDASILANSPTTNFGSDTTLQADSDSLENFLLKFSVAGIGSGTVVSAKLRLFNVNPSSLGGDFYRVADTTWTESTVTWDNAPAADATALASLGPVSINTWYEVNVTSLVTGDGVYSLRVASTSSDGADYSSKESANAPQLIITFS